MVGPRRAAREVALRALYALDVNPALAPPQAVVAVLDGWTDTGETASGGSEAMDFEPLEADIHGFALRLVESTVARRGDIDGLLSEASTNWRIERMSVVDRSVLRLATCELLIWPDTPTAIVVSEAVELGRRYGSESSSAFINGVLDAVARRRK